MQPLVVGRYARMLSLVFAAIWSLTAASAQAHEEGSGVDAGFGHIIVTVGADGNARVELHISEAGDCEGFEAVGVSATRADTAVTGGVDHVNPCLLGGLLALPEQGRWALEMQLTYDERPTAIGLPVGFSGEAGTFERTDWLHVAAPAAARPWYHPSGTLAYAVIGLLIGTAIELGRRRIIARRGLTTS